MAAARVADAYQRWDADACFIDVGGVGAGVYDRCLALNLNVIPSTSGRRPWPPRGLRTGAARSGGRWRSGWSAPASPPRPTP